jgi:hypothetical protein
MKRTWWSMPLALCVAMVTPSGALAAGGPVAPVQNSYIGTAGSPYRYGAFDSRGNTVVKLKESGARAAVPVLRLRGRYGVPGVDYNGSLTGLSADGRTLVLAQIASSSPRSTRLLVLGTNPLRIRTRLTLPGFSTVDAISPDGRWLYLIHYASSTNLTNYEVLAYDLPAHRLLSQPVVDPKERDEAMTGIPISRVMSAGGRWAYTLYLRPSGVPFIHALDTTHHRAVCIDLGPLGNLNDTSERLVLLPGGSTLRVDGDLSTRVSVDTRTFRVSASEAESAPAAPASSPPPKRGSTPHSSHVPWQLIVLAIAVLGAVAAGGAGAARSRRQRQFERGPDGAVIIHVDARPPDRSPADDELPVA